MAESKESKKSAKKIIDVQHPGKTPATATSKPVLVTNRPILQDPMMVEEDSKEEKIPLTRSGATIQPLTAPEVPDKKTKADKPDDSAREIDPPDTPIKPEVDTTKTIAEIDAEVKKNEKSTEAVTSKPAPVSPAEDAPEDSARRDGEAKAAKEQADEAAAKQDLELQALADSKKYFLPITTIEKRRSKRVVIGGVLLSLLLIVVWADVALDAGLVADNGLPHTSYFEKLSSAPDAGPVQLADTKTYRAPNSKMVFKYPSAWHFAQSSEAGNGDDAWVTPADTLKADSRIIVEFMDPTLDTDKLTDTVSYIKYQKLLRADGDVYLADMIYQFGPEKFAVKSFLTNDNSLKAQNQPADYTQSFKIPGAADATFLVHLDKKPTAPDFKTIQEAQAFMKTANYQKARQILLTASIPKS